MDTFFEQIISVKKTGKTVLGIIGIWTLAILLCVTAFLFLGSLSLIIIAGLIFGAYVLSHNFNIEYEYIITNGTFDVDKIINKSSRKRVLSLELSKVSRLEKYNPAALSKVKSKDIIFACNEKDPEAYLLVTSKEGKGTTYLIFAPDERIRTAVAKFVPKFISNSAFR